ncbi:TRAP transporter large permease subunit [Falsigemmobacter faecalis]|uniref:TRAP transporter large permease subunit n=1 Tax=Falsigemmobacter faecalis TaxID=2488730 RepID=UPI001F15D2CD|nr:TRAP transporter large permease subunit [Falsigemmobacter faecalis]
MVGGALVFNYVVTIGTIPETLRAVLQGRALTALQFLLLVNVIVLVSGCVPEGMAVLLIIVPVFIPAAQAPGIDLVHFGVMVVVSILPGLVTPPYGILLFNMTNITGTPMKYLIRDGLPFLGWMVLCLALITCFPDLVLWLPRLAGYGG